MFLYVDGKTDGISKDLVELVRFVGNTSAGNACSPKLEELLGYIDDLKQNPEVKEAYMTFEEYVESERREERYEILMEIEKIKAERDAAVNERNAMKEELDAKDEALNAKDKEINAVIRERDAIREEINAIEEEINAIEKQRNAIEKRRSAIEERRSAIEEFNVALQRIKELEKILKNNGTRSSTDTYG